MKNGFDPYGLFSTIDIPMKHDKNKIQLQYSEMLKELIEMPKWKLAKRWKKIKEIRKFATEHKICCELEW